MMDKQTLIDYVDACELVKESSKAIKNMRKERFVSDHVSGSNPKFPYEPRHFHIGGAVEVYVDGRELIYEKNRLHESKKTAEKIKAEVEAWLPTVPPRMQRIVRYKFFDGLTWEEVAVRMGKKSTADSIRKEFNRFFEKKGNAGQ